MTFPTPAAKEVQYQHHDVPLRLREAIKNAPLSSGLGLWNYLWTFIQHNIQKLNFFHLPFCVISDKNAKNWIFYNFNKLSDMAIILVSQR